MYNNKCLAGLRRVLRVGMVLCTCFLPAAVLAEADVQFSGEVELVPDRVMPAKPVISNNSGAEDAVILQDENVQAQIIAAAFTPSGRGMEHEVSSDQATPRLHATEQKESRQLPYSLVLALIALIGLVPVSRRNH